MDLLISIIVPVYKVEEFLDNCIKSIIDQTFKNIEIILVDDGSPDQCPQLCDEWAVKDPRIRVIHKKNGGLSSARNAGIKEASGDYLYFLDSDDRFYSSDSLELLCNLVKAHPGVDVVQGNFYVEENHSQTFNKRTFPAFTDKKSWIQSNLATMTIPESACNKLIKRSIITNNSLYFREGWIQEDTLWSYQIHSYIENIAFCVEPTYFYAFNSNSIMHSSGNEKEANAFLRILNEVYSNLQTKMVHDYDIRFLEIMAMRALKANGPDVYSMMAPYKNMLFRCAFKLNNIADHNSNNFLIKCVCKGMVVVLRRILCNKYLFK